VVQSQAKIFLSHNLTLLLRESIKIYKSDL